MIVTLVDNGSLEAAAHLNLRAVAAAMSAETGVKVHAVSWKHSDRIPAAELGGAPAWTVGRFLREMIAFGQREFVFVPFFISPQGAIGSALHSDLAKLQSELGGFEFTFTDGLAARDVVPSIVADRVRTTLRAQGLHRPPVIVVDHGGPSATSAALRDELAAAIRHALSGEIGELTAASMEGEHPPLLVDALRRPTLGDQPVVVAPLFLSPGRHAGPTGDVQRICAAAPARSFVTDLVGTHPLAVTALAAALQDTLSALHAQPFA